MPELPEVETIRIGLSRLLPGKVITSVWRDWEKSFPNAEADVNEFLIGARVTGVRRRAKVLIIDLGSAYSLVIHLKMTGQLVYISKPELSVVSNSLSVKTENGKKVTDNNLSSEDERFAAGHPSDSLISKLPDKSTRVIFDLEELGDRLSRVDGVQGKGEQRTEVYTKYGDGAALPVTSQHAKSISRFPGTARKQANAVRRPKLFFNDQRKFGWIRLLPTPEVENIDFFKRVGPEPLSSEFTQAEFRSRLRRRANTNIKAALLDQTVIAGIGNIYADESLWEARIRPSLLVKNISDSKLNKLFTAIRKVLILSIEMGGSTDRNYVNAEGQKGSYLSFAKVFRRNGFPCQRCGTVIIKTRVAGRGTHICPKCQP
ncbi:hypothetical protein BH23PAT1_BH23PAT1_0550 [soil metagenome]